MSGHYYLPLLTKTKLFSYYDSRAKLSSKYLQIYFNKLKDYLNIAHESSNPFPKCQLTDEQFSKKVHRANVAAVNFQLGFSKGLRALIDDHSKLLSPAKMIAPVSINYWSMSKARVGAMSRLLTRVSTQGRRENPA